VLIFFESVPESFAQNAIFFPRFDHVIYEQQQKGGNAAPFSDGYRCTRDCDKHPRVNWMAKPGIWAGAHELVVRLDLNLVAPIVPKMPPRPDHEQNAETSCRNPEVTNGRMIGNETPYQWPSGGYRWRQKKDKCQSQNEQPQEPVRVWFSGLCRVPRCSASADDPVKTSRCPQPVQRRMSLGGSRNLLLGIGYRLRAVKLFGQNLAPSVRSRRNGHRQQHSRPIPRRVAERIRSKIRCSSLNSVHDPSSAAVPRSLISRSVVRFPPCSPQ
jgi:hypothetical protein